MSHSKDIAEKQFEDINAIFADIINLFVFDGDNIVRPEDLQDTGLRSQLKLGKALHEQERDVAKLWTGTQGGIVFCLYGIENQTVIDKDMPLRCIAYDGAAYKKQVNQHNSKEPSVPTYPVATIVLYFGAGKWTGPTSLLDCIDVGINPKLKPFVNDYKIHVFSMQTLPEEAVQQCRSDFRYVVDWAVKAGQGRTDFVDGIVQYPDALTKLLSSLTGDNRWEDAYNILHEKEELHMCELLDMIEKRGETKGKIEGAEQAEAKFSKLLAKLLSIGAQDDIVRIASDATYRAGLYKKYNI